MATKIKRGKSWEYIVKRKALLPRPLSMTFRDENEGDTYIARLEKLLDAGVVPPEFADQADTPTTLGQAIRVYTSKVAVTDVDELLLISIGKRQGNTRLFLIDYAWAENYVRGLKHTRSLAPSTIKHHVGAMSRLGSWLVRQKFIVSNPFRELPRGYANYAPGDHAVLAATGDTAPGNTERDRRLNGDEEKRIRAVLAGIPMEAEAVAKTLKLKHREALVLLFDLALETGMRLREMYTLTQDQVDAKQRTIFLEKTKNGDKRQVPLSTVALTRLREYSGTDEATGQLFPWWNGDPSGAALRKITALLSAQFARIFDVAQCGDVHFHDLRHEACCRLYERTQLSDVEIAKIMGWKSLKMALRYANLRGSNLAGKLW